MRRLALPALLSFSLLGFALAVAKATPANVPGLGEAADPAVFSVVDPQGRQLPHAVADSVERDTVVPTGSGFVVRDTTVATFRAPGYLPRALAVSFGRRAPVVLTPAVGAVSLRFGGDTMLGRRFFEPVEGVGDGKPLLPLDAAPTQEAALFEPVQPLLEDSDLTVLNLETALLKDPYLPSTAPRPAGLHPTKDLVITSPTTFATALRRVGVDVVDLANNHVYDALDVGLATTVDALDRAGIAHVGAGRTPDEAWAPVTVTVRGIPVTFVACTTVAGRQHEIEYVATPTHGGAAECATGRLAGEVGRARAEHPNGPVVVLLHGDVEYQRDQVAVVTNLTRVARAAGASTVVTTHPHVLGGITAEEGFVSAQTLGNFAFDQTLWSTVASASLRVDLQGPRPVHAMVDPLLLEDFTPRPAVGHAGSTISRLAVGRGTGLVLHDDAAEWLPGSPVARSRTVAADGITGVPDGAVLTSASTATVGTDLLYGLGDFEDADPSPLSGGGRSWMYGKFAKQTRKDACDGHGQAVVLERSSVSNDEVFVSPRHRVDISPGLKLSLTAYVDAATPGVLELRWYSASRGKAASVTAVTIPRTGGACRTIRLDVTAPRGFTAVQPFIRLAPPDSGYLDARLVIDDVRLVQWAGRGQSGARYDVVDATTPTQLTVTTTAPTR